jgi:hypothetical protein
MFISKNTNNPNVNKITIHIGIHPKAINIKNNTTDAVNITFLGMLSKPKEILTTAIKINESKKPPKSVESIGSKNVSINSKNNIYTSHTLL